jgi:hypothetical protein
MGLHRPEVIAQKIDAIAGLCGEGKERRQRNYERAWLGIFIADKSFGIATGRPICVSWRELMPDVGEWWRGKWAGPYDRLLCGIAEMRLIVVSRTHAISLNSGHNEAHQHRSKHSKLVRPLRDLRSPFSSGRTTTLAPYLASAIVAAHTWSTRCLSHHL